MSDVPSLKEVNSRYTGVRHADGGYDLDTGCMRMSDHPAGGATTRDEQHVVRRLLQTAEPLATASPPKCIELGD